MFFYRNRMFPRNQQKLFVQVKAWLKTALFTLTVFIISNACFHSQDKVVTFVCFPAIGVSFDCCSNIYCGTQPVSEPEAQAVTYFVGSRIDEFLCFLTIHSYGQLLLLPYGHPNFTASNYNELVFESRNVCLTEDERTPACVMT